MDTSRFNGLRSAAMSLHSYSRCWLHLIWGTLKREKLLNKPVAARVSHQLAEYAETKGIYMKINYVNADHVHLLVALGRQTSIAELVRLVKCNSSGWVHDTFPGHQDFAWQNGYGAFSISPAHVEKLREYIAKQEEHHSTESFQDELRRLFTIYALQWDEKYVWD